MAFGKRLRLLLLLATLSAGATMRTGAQGIYAETVWEAGTALEAGRIREAGKVREAGVQRGYPAAAGWEYMLSPGRAVMEGRIMDGRTGTPPKTFTVRVEDIFGDEERNVLVQPDKEGYFRAEVPLPYPQFVYVDNVDYVFLFPGDTLRCELQADGGRRMAAGSDRQVFTGDNTSAEVNCKWREIEPRYFGGIAMPHEVYRKDKAEVFMRKNNIRGEHIFLTADEWNYLSAKFNFSAIPFKVIIDRQGNIHPHSAEVPSREELEKFINL